jgi:hypothetical protein
MKTPLPFVWIDPDLDGGELPLQNPPMVPCTGGPLYPEPISVAKPEPLTTEKFEQGVLGL